MLGIMLNVNLTSCSKEDIAPDTEQGENNDGGEEGGQVVHPNGIPSDIPNNIIYYITSDNIIIRFGNDDVFGGARIVSNTYSSTKGYGTIEFSSEVTAVEANAFYERYTLTYIALPNSVTSIGNKAFSKCYGLASVFIPNSVKSIGEDAFAYCNGLRSVHISDIAAWCNIHFASSSSNPFCWAHRLYLNGQEVKDLVIPNSVTRIGNYAFYGCSGLTSVTIPNSVTRIGYCAFSSFGLASFVVKEGNTVYDSRNNCNAIIETASNTLICGCKTTIIPNDVESIGSGAFYNCDGLTSVTIPNSVESIGPSAFYQCSGLTSVTIGNSVTSIEKYTFYGCSGLTSVTIGNSVESIVGFAFSGCSNLLDVYCHAESVPDAESYAFEDSPIENVTLHVPVASIDSYNATMPWCNFGKIVGLTPEETSIDEQKGEDGKLKSAVYDLSGRRVQNATKSIYIQNGKKFIK